MRNRLWPAQTFVDFEHSLNTASRSFARLWEILRKTHGTWRRFRRVGYRFIAPVEQVSATLPPSVEVSVVTDRSGTSAIVGGAGKAQTADRFQSCHSSDRRAGAYFGGHASEAAHTHQSKIASEIHGSIDGRESTRSNKQAPSSPKSAEARDCISRACISGTKERCRDFSKR